jgi:hypothetical protein
MGEPGQTNEPGQTSEPGESAARDQGAEPAGERQAPFFCPYCGDEGLRPGGAKAGHWDCHSCARSFHLRFAGVLRAESPHHGRLS